MIRLAAACVLVVSCAAVGVRGQTIDNAALVRSTAYGWRALGRTDAPPRILVVQGAALTCTTPTSRQPGFWVVLKTGRECREGYSLVPGTISVAWSGQPWSRTVLVHELTHEALGRRGIFDAGHKRAADWARVNAINGELAALGL